MNNFVEGKNQIHFAVLLLGRGISLFPSPVPRAKPKSSTQVFQSVPKQFVYRIHKSGAKEML